MKNCFCFSLDFRNFFSEDRNVNIVNEKFHNGESKNYEKSKKSNYVIKSKKKYDYKFVESSFFYKKIDNINIDIYQWIKVQSYKVMKTNKKIVNVLHIINKKYKFLNIF